VPIRQELEAVMAGVETARAEPLAGHALAARITHDWRDAVAAAD
jgi:hypothetical protein